MKKLHFIAAIFLSQILFFTACSDNNSNPKSEQLAKDETYTCTMHNEVMSVRRGKCPKCAMNLVKQKMTKDQQKMMNEGT